MAPQIEQLKAENVSLQGKLSALEVENKNLRLQVKLLEMAKPLNAKEQEDERQQHLEIKPTESVVALEEPEAEEAKQAQPSRPAKTRQRKKNKRIGIKEKLEHMPIEKETVYIPQEIQNNPELWEEIGQTETNEIIVVPSKMLRHRIVYKKYRSIIERQAAPIVPKAPVRFCSSYASISLAVYIILSKYLEHSTLYRLEQKFARLGFEIKRQSQSDIIERAADWLGPLYEYFDTTLKSGNYLQIDETFIKYINGNTGGSGQGYFWAIHNPEQGIVLKWITNRRHENVETLIDGFSGCLQSDGYAAYSNYAATHPEVQLLACWSHLFRKFRDALEHEPTHAQEMMSLIGKLYKLEEQWKKDSIDAAERGQLRGQHSKPIIETIRNKLDAHSADMSIPNNAFRQAVTYAHNQWEALERCFEHGHNQIDTNLLESKFRPTKIGQKNWMHIGHPEAGEKSAIMYTFIASCRIHKINPQYYLTDVLEQLVAAYPEPPPSLLQKLLPKQWAQNHPDKLIKETV